MFARVFQFLQQDIWRIRLRTLPPYKYYAFRFLRILTLALRGFGEDQCHLRASALTYYSLLSIVPVLAMAFGMAKGFGFEQNLINLLNERLATQQEVLTWLLSFTNTFLANTRGGVIAGVGVGILFWAVIKVLGNIEKSFNDIWGITQHRTMTRKLTDYLSIMLICPLLLIMASSLTLFITSQVTLITERVALLGPISGLIFSLLKLLPYAMLWVLFSFIYMFLPNTRVSFKSGLLAGVAAGTIYELVQWGYIHFQVGVTKYNAIYGSFAAMPLFLVWLQLSWLVVLLGAEVSFAVDNDETYEFERDCLDTSPRFKRLLALRILEICAKRFRNGNPPLHAVALAHQLEAPIRLVRDLIHELVQGQLLSEVQLDGTADHFQPALDIDKLTLYHVIEKLDTRGHDHEGLVKSQELDQLAEQLTTMNETCAKSAANVLLTNL